MGKTIINGQEVFTSSQNAKNIAYPVDDEYKTMQDEIDELSNNLTQLIKINPLSINVSITAKNQTQKIEIQSAVEEGYIPVSCYFNSDTRPVLLGNPYKHNGIYNVQLTYDDVATVQGTLYVVLLKII